MVVLQDTLKVTCVDDDDPGIGEGIWLNLKRVMNNIICSIVFIVLGGWPQS